jgi:hypothetical protein
MEKYLDFSGKEIPLKDIKLYYSMGWMEKRSELNYVCKLERSLFSRKDEEENLMQKRKEKQY